MVNSHRPKQILLRRDAADLHSQLSQWKEVISIVQENAQQKGVPAEIVFINVNLLAAVKRMHARTLHWKMNKVIKRPLASLY